MQKFKVADDANPDGSAKDLIIGVQSGTKYKSKVWNDNFFNMFKAVENQGYTLIDDDLTQLTKAMKGKYDALFTYNSSSAVTQSVNDVVEGSDGQFYECQSDGTIGDDPVGSVTGDWKLKGDNNIPKNFSLDTGALNTIELFNAISLKNLKDGMMVFFEAANTNTGATTIKLAGLTAKALVIDNVALVGGEVILDTLVAAVYNATNDNFELKTFGGSSFVGLPSASMFLTSDQGIFSSASTKIALSVGDISDSGIFQFSGNAMTMPAGRYFITQYAMVKALVGTTYFLTSRKDGNTSNVVKVDDEDGSVDRPVYGGRLVTFSTPETVELYSQTTDTNYTVRGDADNAFTGMTFIRLGD